MESYDYICYNNGEILHHKYNRYNRPERTSIFKPCMVNINIPNYKTIINNYFFYGNETVIINN